MSNTSRPGTTTTAANSSTNPAYSSVNPPDFVRQIKRLIPFCQPQTVKSGYKMARGIVLIISVTANTDTTLHHILGRIPNWLIVLDAGTTYAPKWKRSTATAWTTTTATVQFDTTVTALTVWVV
jgi:hypothetical protein